MKYLKLTLFLLSWQASATLTAGFDPELYRMIQYRDSLENTLEFKKGSLSLPGGTANLYVPAGFKVLEKNISEELLPMVWKVSVPEGLQFTMYPVNGGPFDSRNERFTICEWTTGHIFDNDFISGDSTLAMPVNGDTLWKAWLIPPNYDPNRHILWFVRSFNHVKDSFERFEMTFYFLGKSKLIRLQTFNMMYDWELIKTNIPGILDAVTYNTGEAYEDYNKETVEAGFELVDLIRVEKKNTSHKSCFTIPPSYLFTGLLIISGLIVILFLRSRKSN